MIDGLVVIEPNINPDSAGLFAIDFGGEVFTGHGTSLYDNHTLMAIYAPCAALSPGLAGTPFNLDPIGAPPGSRATRCQALYEQGLLQAATLNDQAVEALSILREHGYYQEQGHAARLTRVAQSVAGLEPDLCSRTRAVCGVG